ncbi:BadF/BadG/BcrA/BcrD ATPase family protein [Bacillus niameyensis]|uniref:BadF/BadG/BcrA/BcrD ATPase family protein n=1 Tax=Bacillus niameyensis TaxID=1522308 RepID=UPI00078613AD|nr:BadF/BadG/BcrA/BcrD ATPase family protein [Bacillus niameyensis]
MQNSYVIGLEGGGSFTRVMVADLQGNILAYKESGSAHPYRDPRAGENIQNAVLQALRTAEVSLNEVVHFTAGLPSYQQEEDLPLAHSLLDIEGLACQKTIVNDSVVGHAGALLFQPGIMVVSGTGSIVMGYTENGHVLFNSTFRHYAPTAARFLSYQAIHYLLAGQVELEDTAFIEQIFEFWGVKDMAEFRELALQDYHLSKQEMDRRFGLMAPILTVAASQGVPLAVRVCDEAIRTLETGVRLLGSYFTDHDIPVCFVGSVIRSPYFSRRFSDILQRCSHKRYNIMEPLMSPVAGAVAMSLKESGIHVTDNIVERLLMHEKSLVSVL